jgi:ribosomal-protein-serine acetyltransferase
LTLRAPSAEDAVHLHLAIADSLGELRPWIKWAQELPTIEVVREKSIEARALMDRGEYFAWRAYLRGTEVIVGSIDLHKWDWSIAKCEIGYWGSTPHYGHGYVTEAVTAIVNVAATHLDVRRFEALCDSRNLRSQRLAERAGFTRETILRDYERDVRGDLCDQVLFVRRLEF